MSVGQNIKNQREAEHLDQTELAERVDTTQGMISLIESGRKNPSIPLLVAIAQALHCTPNDLILGPQKDAVPNATDH